MDLQQAGRSAMEGKNEARMAGVCVFVRVHILTLQPATGPRPGFLHSAASLQESFLF